MSDYPSLVRQTEARAKAIGLSVPDLLARAAINRATWTRWKSGKSWPNTRKWDAVQAVIADRAA